MSGSESEGQFAFLDTSDCSDGSGSEYGMCEFHVVCAAGWCWVASSPKADTSKSCQLAFPFVALSLAPLSKMTHWYIIRMF